jgi:hypothetical protein
MSAIDPTKPVFGNPSTADDRAQMAIVKSEIEALEAHAADTANPHTVTPAQLSLVIGTNTQAWSALLDAIHAATSGADKLPYYDGINSAALADITAVARTFLAAINTTAQQQALGLEPGVDVQAFAAGLLDIAGLNPTLGNIIVGNGSNWTAQLGQVARASLEIPYDMAWVGGFDTSMDPIACVVQKYARFVAGRDGTFIGETGYIETAPTGTALIVDFQKWTGASFTSIYSTLPQFAAGNNTITNGTLKTDGTEDFVEGDRFIGQVTQIGSSSAGSGLQVTQKVKQT